MNTLETITAEQVKAHIFEADMLAETAQEIESGRHKFANGRLSEHLICFTRDLISNEFWSMSHGIHEWLNSSHGVPMACACPVYCARKEQGGAQ